MRSYANELGTTRKKKRKAPPKIRKEPKEKKQKTSLVNSIDVQVKLLRRFRLMTREGWMYTHTEVETFIKKLQKAIYETPIRKSDRYAAQIEEAQRFVINAYNNRGAGMIGIKIPAAFRQELEVIAKSEKVRPSVALLKRIVGCVGLPYNKAAKRFKNIRKALDFMHERGLVKESDPYYDMLRTCARALDKAMSNHKPLQISSAMLSGLNGIIRKETSF